MGLQNLPPEILLHIFDDFGSQDLLKTALVCRNLLETSLYLKWSKSWVPLREFCHSLIGDVPEDPLYGSTVNPQQIVRFRLRASAVSRIICDIESQTDVALRVLQALVEATPDTPLFPTLKHLHSKCYRNVVVNPCFGSPELLKTFTIKPVSGRFTRPNSATLKHNSHEVLLLSAYYTGLEELMLDMGACIPLPNDIPLLPSLLRLEIHGVPRPSLWRGIVSNPTLEEIVISVPYVFDIVDMTELETEEIKLRSLRKLVVKGGFCEDFCQVVATSSFMPSLLNLEMCGPLQLHHLQSLSRSTHLEELVIVVNGPLDYSAFAQYSAIRDLALRRVQGVLTDDDVLHLASSVPNIRSLTLGHPQWLYGSDQKLTITSLNSIQSYCPILEELCMPLVHAPNANATTRTPFRCLKRIEFLPLIIKSGDVEPFGAALASLCPNVSKLHANVVQALLDWDGAWSEGFEPSDFPFREAFFKHQRELNGTDRDP